MRLYGMALVLCAALVGTCVADGNAGKELKKAVKATLRAESYRVAFDAEGGFADGPEHTLIDNHLQYAVEARNYGRLTAIDRPFEGFRIDGTEVGAFNAGDRWITLVSRPIERIPERLMVPLSQVLQEAAALHRTAIWLEEEARVRVTAPSKRAVQMFNDLQASGCFAQCPMPEQQGQQPSGGGC